MKKGVYAFILAIFLMYNPIFSQAKGLDQKEKISRIVMEKISTKTLLKINGGDFVLTGPVKEKWISEKTDLYYNPDYRSEIENPNYCQYRKSIGCNLIFDTKKSTHIQKKSVIEFNEKLIASYLDDLGRQANKDPVNAKLKMENGKVLVFSLSSRGISLNKDEGLQKLLGYFTSTENPEYVDLPFDEVEPEISTDSIDNMGIKTLIGEGRSNFRGSPKNRIFNINVATNRFNGTLIKPGEEFSFVKILGPVDGEHGYMPELVIKKDKTEPEFGGGICQVSTTAFRAAIYSGLEITARRNHAYPVKYYNPQGLDATVYVPRPDLRFINNTSGYILIQTKIEGTELVFQFYGTDDGRKVNIIGPKIIESNSDGSMKATFTQQVYDSNGSLIIDDVFNSNYESPSKFPHPGEILTKKPEGWSSQEWKKYKKDNNL